MALLTHVPQIDRVTLGTAPDRSDDPKVYQQNVERWTRDCERVIRAYEKALRAVIASINAS